jgi:hypothetical protein
VLAGNFEAVVSLAKAPNRYKIVSRAIKRYAANPNANDLQVVADNASKLPLGQVKGFIRRNKHEDTTKILLSVLGADYKPEGLFVGHTKDLKALLKNGINPLQGIPDHSEANLVASIVKTGDLELCKTLFKYRVGEGSLNKRSNFEELDETSACWNIWSTNRRISTKTPW